MQKVRINKRISAMFIAVAMAVTFALLSTFVTLTDSAGSLFGSMSTGALGAEGDEVTSTSNRIKITDLMERYPIDWVIGPIDMNADGSYKHFLKDANGNELKQDGLSIGTNNAFNIPEERYFNVENYICMEKNTDKLGEDAAGETIFGRTIYGWKPDIWGVKYDRNKVSIAHTTGYIVGNYSNIYGPSANMSDNQVGIYCNYNGDVMGGTT